jgi:hypothetical protein
MLRDMSSRLLPLLPALALAACTTTQGVSTAELRSLASGGHREAQVLRATDGSSVRIDPNTAIRFKTYDGRASDWYSARALEVGDHGVIVRRGKSTRAIAWGEINAVEAKNLSGSKSLALVLGSAAVVAVIVALAADDDGVAKHIIHHHHHPHPIVIVNAAAGGEPPEEDSEYAYREPGGARIEPVLNADAAETHELFEGTVRRRSMVEFVPSLTMHASLANNGLSAFDPLRYAQTVAISARMSEMFELGAGVRHVSAAFQHDGALFTESQVLGFFRVGGHFNLDDNHRVAIPLYMDVGFGGDVTVEMRIAIGLRVRAYDTFTIGLYPAIPTYTRFDDVARFGGSRWTYPSAIEATFAF